VAQRMPAAATAAALPIWRLRDDFTFISLMAVRDFRTWGWRSG
jgi:hypothetical protein